MTNLKEIEIQQKIDNINFASEHIKQLVSYGANVDKKQFTCEDLRNFDIFKSNFKRLKSELKLKVQDIKVKYSFANELKQNIFTRALFEVFCEQNKIVEIEQKNTLSNLVEVVNLKRYVFGKSNNKLHEVCNGHILEVGGCGIKQSRAKFLINKLKQFGLNIKVVALKKDSNKYDNQGAIIDTYTEPTYALLIYIDNLINDLENCDEFKIFKHTDYNANINEFIANDAVFEKQCLKNALNFDDYNISNLVQKVATENVNNVNQEQEKQKQEQEQEQEQVEQVATEQMKNVEVDVVDVVDVDVDKTKNKKQKNQKTQNGIKININTTLYQKRENGKRYVHNLKSVVVEQERGGISVKTTRGLLLGTFGLNDLKYEKEKNRYVVEIVKGGFYKTIIFDNNIFKALARQNLKKQSEEVKRKSSAISKIKKGIVIFFKKTTCDFLKKAACFNF